YYPEQLLSDEPEYRPRLGRLRFGGHPNPWGRCVLNRWGYYRYRPYYGYRPYWQSYYPGDYIRIGSVGIGTATDRQSATKPYKRGIAIWSFRCEFVLEQKFLLRNQERTHDAEAYCQVDCGHHGIDFARPRRARPDRHVLLHRPGREDKEVHNRG